MTSQVFARYVVSGLVASATTVLIYSLLNVCCLKGGLEEGIIICLLLWILGFYYSGESLREDEK